ncbi:TPA: phage tail tape measure protein [Acinetobacter baumannii]|uniref:Phage tail tape measure protein n=1 Tax=Acinetobacter nosocomialis TaxID=106654 RepID=A0AB37CSG4_ACINO|nr:MULTISPECIES: phage tail tape measure protein [Acinetobacter calcoaceticus/baumannii complex]MCJ9113934.1 phage tail tape measure protein [Acinetobacter baumannii]MDP7803293.1 phage tail tape measure protein [Acinetobacter baumannii]QGA43060.1 phage tail tape measure protein [Acinetobacter nosocomialis]HAV4952363.1 phage tail tape measure protein [Acinetobacter baumannii]HCE0781921.1 phage tail tape measure protein [Acinetobacter baumannii]
MKPLKLEVLFGSRDNLSPALKLIIGSSNAAANALKNARDEVKRLNEQQKQVDGFVRQKKATEDSAKALKDVQERIKSLRQEMTTNPSDKISKDFDKATKEAKKLKDAHSQNQAKLQELRNELKQTGVSTSNLADHQSELSRKITTANASIDNQKKKLDSLNRIQKSHSNISGNVRTAALYGAGMTATGAAALYQMRKPIDESKRVDVEENRIASLGFGKKATDEAVQYAKAMKTFGTSTLDNLTLVRDGVTAFGDVHHAQWVAPTLAKMKFANEAMYGDHGVENEKKFMDMLKVIEMRNGLKSKESFQEQANIIQQVITATGGRVQAEEWLNVIKTGGIAAKGMDNKAFYYKMEPLVQEMGGHRVGTSMMSAYQNLYQGRTTQRAAANLDKFGLIGDYSKVKHNKTGDLSYLDIGAIKGADLFKKDQFAWMEKVLVPALNAKGITKESDVIDAIGSIFSNRTASNLFAQMYMQRDQIHKNAKLNEGAFNIDQLNTQAQGTTSGKELEARAKLHDAYLQFGQTILPIYTQALIMASNAMQGFTGWMQQNPTLAKALGTGLLLIAGGLVAIGGLLLIFSPLILSMLSLRLMMVTLGVQGSALSFVFKMLTSPFKALGSSVMWLGRMLFAAGQLMRANPIILAVTLLATAAYFIYQNWAPIKSFFMDLWTGVKNAFNTGVSFIKGIIQSVDQVFADNPLLNLLFPLIGIPRLIIANWSGITGFFSSVWTSITTGVANVWNSIVSYLGPIGDWFAAKWENIKLVTSVVWSGIKSVVTTAWDNLISAITNSPLFQRIVDGWTKIFDYLGSLKNKMLSIGKNIIDGLVNGIQSGFDSLKTIWAKINSYMPSFMKKKMDIHSPSRVMAGLGGHIVGGIGMGLTQAFPELKNKYNQVLNLFSNKAQSPVLEQVDIAAPVLSKIQTQATPNTVPSRQSSLAVAGDTYTIHIHAAPGQMVQDLERQIEQVINRLQRDKLSRVRTIMADQE